MTEAAARESVVRRWCVVGVSVSALFAAYIGLVPFHFDLTRGEFILDTFLNRAELGITSRANFLANAVLSVPIGFFGAGAFIRQKTGAPFAAALGSLLIGSAALSLSLEILQALAPTRTPSMSDVVAQMFGAAIGVAGWLSVRRDVHAWAASSSPSDSIGPLQTSLWVYAAFRSLALLLPLDVTVSLSTLVEKYHEGRIVIDPRHTLGSTDALQAGAAGIVLNAPIGVLLYLVATRLTARGSVVLAVALGAAYTAAMELAQVIVISRSADAADIITGTIGVVVGAVAGAAFLDVHGAREAIRIRPFRYLAAVGALVSLATYAAYNLSPFDFTRPPDVAARVSMLFQVPFYSYYDGPELQALDGAVLKTLLGVPAGLFCGLSFVSPLKVYPRGVSAAALLAGAIFFGAVEAGQVLLPSRYPDNTDVVLATCGMWAGLSAIRLFTR